MSQCRIENVSFVDSDFKPNFEYVLLAYVLMNARFYVRPDLFTLCEEMSVLSFEFLLDVRSSRSID